MTETEEYFPRGGKKPAQAKFFKQSINFLGAPEKAAKKRKKPKKNVEGDDGYLSDEVSKEPRVEQQYCAPGLTFKTTTEGMLILGRVQNASETKVKVMLPSKICGTVMACHVSEAYNKQLEDYVNDKIDKVRELPSMFRPGQYVATKVLEVENDHVMLSLMPQHVNGGKTHADLTKGVILQAAVSSVEDHGYVMDIGVANTTAFLPKKSANPDVELDVGSIAWCCVSSTTPSSDASVVTLASDLSSLNKAMVKKKSNTPLLPATPVLLTVDKPLDNGIECRVFGGTTAYVKRNHATSVKGKKPGLGQKVKGYLLYVMPIRQAPFFTMRNIFETTFPDLSEEQKYKEGDIVEDAQVLKITGRMVIFRLSPGSFGSMGLRRVQAQEELTDEQVLARSYPVGSAHKLRILQYNLSDFLYSVSDCSSVLNERYFSIRELSVGDQVDVVVRNVMESQLRVAVGRVSGIVPHTHMSDAGFYVDHKKPSLSKLPKKKFKEGKELKARVLCVDLEKNSLILTVKPTLVNLPREDILTEYSEAEIGKAYTGVIKYIRNDYILVSFFNHVTAYVPRNYVTKEETDNLADVYHLGQIVNCTIIKVDAENKKMVGSLTTAPFWPNKKREIPVKRKQSESDEQPVLSKKRKSSESEDLPSKAKTESKSDNTKVGKKKKDKQKKESEGESSNEKEIVSESKEIKTKKEKKRKVSENEEVTTEVEEVIETKKSKKKNKDKQKQEEVNIIKQSDESDAIETDIYEDENTLSPRDQGLVDFADCETIEQFKKRASDIKKSIQTKHLRINRINLKIKNIETKGLTPKNKKFHTAMHTEKLVLEQNIEQLETALKSAKQQVKILKNYNRTEGSNEKVKSKKKKDKDSLIDEVIKVVDSSKPVIEVPSAKDFWSTNDDSVQNVVEESSSSEDEDEQQPKKKRKKLTVAEKLSKAREEEEKIRDLESRAINNEGLPRSSDQFERALLASPDCSQLWIAYMAFHLQSTEVDKARAVGKRALSNMSFREEQEKLNVWLALINIEIRFGTKETQQKTLEDALQLNEPYSIHSKLLDMYLETGQLQELSSLVDLMMRRYKRQVDSYVACGTVCYKGGLVEKARQVMQKAIAVLDKKQHVSLLVQFALLERSHGSRERAEAIFEQIAAVYPKRVDVTCAYADMLVKCQDLERVRQVMERMTSQKLPARKMKVLYKKWIEIEEKVGEAEQAENIRQRAMAYIEKAKF